MACTPWSHALDLCCQLLVPRIDSADMFLCHKLRRPFAVDSLLRLAQCCVVPAPRNTAAAFAVDSSLVFASAVEALLNPEPCITGHGGGLLREAWPRR